MSSKSRRRKPTNELSGDPNGIIAYNEEGKPVTRADWLDIMAVVGELARADGLRLVINEDPATGELLYMLADQEAGR
jgi:hypothetical protein